jgi:pimeloyl-ACP methyl ester carboxylesterase
MNARMKTLLRCFALIALLTGCASGLQVRDLGSAHVGEQMYAQFVRLESPRARHPLLLLRGGGPAGATWETRPDGRPGWQSFFLRAGHDVYIARSSKEAPTQAAYDALVQRVCPCVIIAHGEGAHVAMSAAQAAPDRVKAVVAVQPSGAPDPSRFDLPRLRATPHLFVWGDDLGEQAASKRIVPAVNRYRDGLRAAGVPADELDLPKAGVRGNSHMLMTDRNSDEIAARIQRWLEEKELAR